MESRIPTSEFSSSRKPYNFFRKRGRAAVVFIGSGMGSLRLRVCYRAEALDSRFNSTQVYLHEIQLGNQAKYYQFSNLVLANKQFLRTPMTRPRRRFQKITMPEGYNASLWPQLVIDQLSTRKTDQKNSDSPDRLNAKT